MKHKLQSSRVKRLLDELDWDCQDHLHHKTSLNIIHWYPASFITSIPGNIIDIFTEPGDSIWDPFCGCGTSALESFRKGRNFFGNDISEIAVLIAQAKLTLIEHRDCIDKEFKRLISEVGKLDFGLSFQVKDNDFIEIAKGVISIKELLPWYSQKTLDALLILRGLLERYDYGKQFKTAFLVIFLNVAKLACAQQKTWGHIADNVVPDKNQISSNDYNVFQSYARKLSQIMEQANRILIISGNAKYQIKMEGAQTYIPPEPVDIVVTSPPYPSMADYVTSQRLDYYWLGYTVDDINRFKKEEIGPRYLRHNSKRNEVYLRGLKLCFNNIHGNLKDEGLLVLVLPEYKNIDPRSKVIDELFDYLATLMDIRYKTPRNVDENNRWAPFKSLKKETLSIWSKK
jgi:DNA modification methylase